MESSSSNVFGGIVLIGGVIVCAVIGLALLAFWIWMLIHALTNNGLTGSEKIAWVLVIVFVQIIGAIIYFFVGRTKAGLPPPGPIRPG